jgi:hypothetical protein
MSRPIRNQAVDDESAPVGWNGLYRTAGAAALLATALFLSDIVLLAGAIPAVPSAGEWLALMQRDRLTGILELYFNDLAGLLLLIPLLFALYGALRRVSRTYAGMAAAVGLVATAILFASNPNYALVTLSDQYGAAASQAQRTQILAAVELLYATAASTTGFLVGALLIEGALLVSSVLMLRTGSFGKAAAWIGIGGHGLDCLRSIAALILIPLSGAALANAVAIPLLIVGGTLQLIWYPLVARGFFRLAADGARNPAGGADRQHRLSQGEDK